jgi:predicted nucleic acid-binding protein
MATRLNVIADTSVWIAYLRGQDVAAARALDEALDRHIVLMGDLVLVEILRGIATELEARHVLRTLDTLAVFNLGGEAAAIRAATHYRFLRSKGVTVRGTVDLMIATWCIENDVPLLHADRDFVGFEEHLRLKRWATLESRS